MQFVNLKRTGELMDESLISNESKRKRVSENFRLRLLVPSRQAGAIIGKGGSRIKLLRSDNNANVRIADCPGPERIMIIQSDISSTTVKVVEQALTYMSEETDDPKELEIRLVLHDSLVGAVLGKKGTRINDIRSETGCTIKIYKDCCPQSTERVVSVKGSDDKIMVALEMILEAIKGNTIRGPDILYDPINFDAPYAENYGGYGTKSDLKSLPIAPNLVQTTPMSRSGGSFKKDPYNVFNGMGASFKLSAWNPWKFENAEKLAIGSLGDGMVGVSNNAQGINHELGLTAMMGNISKSQMTSSNSLEFPESQENSLCTETKVTIPDSVVGAIIGYGGSRIRDIRITSKAKIKIEEPEESTAERIITISGELKQIKMAQYLLQQAVRENAIIK